MPENPEKIIKQVWQSVENDLSLKLYGLLDAARDSRIYTRLASGEVEVLSLFRGDLARELVAVSPYLIPLERDAPVTEWFFTLGWGNSWGIIIESTEELGNLRRHFQSFFMVYDEDGKPLYFRFYDPRVFRVYLPTCNESEIETVFGPVNSYYVEGEDPGYMIHYARAGRELVERRVNL